MFDVLFNTCPVTTFLKLSSVVEAAVPLRTFTINEFKNTKPIVLLSGVIALVFGVAVEVVCTSFTFNTIKNESIESAASYVALLMKYV